jgi:hypothetical protein
VSRSVRRAICVSESRLLGLLDATRAGIARRAHAEGFLLVRGQEVGLEGGELEGSVRVCFNRRRGRHCGCEGGGIWESLKPWGPESSLSAPGNATWC